MSLYTDPEERNGHPLEVVESFVAREHWEAILTQAALHGLLMCTVTLMLGLEAAPALAVVHLVTFATGVAQGFLAQRLEEMGHGMAAEAVARRAVAALLLSGSALVLLPFVA